MANTMSKYGSNTNRPLSEIVGLSTDTKPTDLIEGIQIQNGSSFRELDTGKKFLFDAENTTWNEVSSGGGGGSTLIEKSISANGVYNASDDSADGYSKVTVDVANSYTQADEGKVVSNGALVAQTTHAEITENGTYDITTNNSVSVNVSGGGVEFSNDPTSFTLLKNIRNLDAVLPDGIVNIYTSGFEGCTGLKSITFPNSLRAINNAAFKGCTGLKTLDLSNTSCTSIGNQAFQSCTNLTNIKLKEDTEMLKDNLFYGCTSLKNIEIPSSVTSIYSKVFYNCTSLEFIKFYSLNPPQISDANTWTNLPTTCIIYVPTGSLSAYTSAQYYPDANTYTYVEY